MNTEMKTFDELVKDPAGTIYRDEKEDGFRFIILRGPGSLCAYIGVKKNSSYHKALLFDEVENTIDNIPDYDTKVERSLDVHGGVTFKGEGDNKFLPKGYYFFGWDYAHAGDKFMFQEFSINHSNDTEWTVKMVEDDSKDGVSGFKKFIKERVKK